MAITVNITLGPTLLEFLLTKKYPIIVTIGDESITLGARYELPEGTTLAFKDPPLDSDPLGFE